MPSRSTAVTVTNLRHKLFPFDVGPRTDGMAFFPAGQFTMGDTLDGESDAIPTSA